MDGDGSSPRVRLGRPDLPFGHALKDVTRQWADTLPYWKDDARAAFQKAFMDEMFLSSRAALSAMGEIERLLSRIVQECA